MSADTTEALLRVERLSIGFRLARDVVPATREISFDVPAESTVALVGESGSGKSVTALSIMGLLPRESAVVAPESAIHYRGSNLLRAGDTTLQDLRGREIAMIFQEPMSALNPVIRIGDQIAEVLRTHLRSSTKQAQSRASELLDEVGIDRPQQRLHSYPHELSGGQQQRVMIAMAIACNPKLLIADEPTTALDVTVQNQILTLLQKLKEKHRMAMLFITHDLALVARIADRVVVLQNGVVCEQGAAQVVFAAPRHVYTRALLACRPRLDRRPERLPVVEDFLRGRDVGNAAARPQRASSNEGGQPVVLSVKNLSKRFFLREGWFGKRPLTAVSDVSFDLPRGKTVGLVGESGSGKSTLGLSLLRLHKADSGTVLLDGVDLQQLNAREFHTYKRRIQIVFQNPYASLNPRFSVAQILLEPMQLHAIGSNDHERLSMAAALLQRVGLEQAALAKYPHEFSGGQRQRIAIARCLSLRPAVLVLDEGVSALDVSVQAQVLNLLRDLQDEYALSYLFISHDLAVVRHMSDYVLVMRGGQVVEQGEADAIYRQPQHAYTRELLAASSIASI